MDIVEARRKVLEIHRRIENGELAKRELIRLQASCQHQWFDVEYNPIIVPGHTVPEFGRGGSDFTPELHVPENKIDRWSRTCRICDLRQDTTEFEVVTTNTPKFEG